VGVENGTVAESGFSPTTGVFAVRCFLDQVTTLAGNGSQGSANGFGAAADFRGPFGVAIDGFGNMYVADTNNNRIRKITAAGEVTTLAGSGNFEFTDGFGVNAQFRAPGGVAVDGAGNVYVADPFNHRIRKITAAGQVTTLAGNGTAGIVDGAESTAQFSSPGGVAVDGAGNVYVADAGNNRIRKITATGQVTTLAGDGTAAQFRFPGGVAVDGAGNVYVADTNNHRIRKITATGQVTTLAGNGTAAFADGAGVNARFDLPYGVAVDGAGNVYVADTANHSIRKITATGQVTTLAGDGATAGIVNGTGAAARFNNPYGVAVDGAGNMYVADASNNRIRKIR